MKAFAGSKVLAGFVAFLLVASQNSAAFETWPGIQDPVHDWISATLKTKYRFSEAAYDKIVDLMADQDVYASDAFLQATNHFDDNTIKESLELMNQRIGQAVAASRDAYKSQSSRDTFYKRLAEVLHAAQDFCAHSNYVELMLRDKGNQITKLQDMPMFDWASLPPAIKTGHYYYSSFAYNENDASIHTSVRELEKIFSPYNALAFLEPTDYCNYLDCDAEYFGDPEQFLDFDKAIAFATQGKFVMHYYLNKDSDDGIMGSMKHPKSGKTLYEFAYFLAEKETNRIWEEIENKIKLLPHGDAILLALKNDSDAAVADSSDIGTIEQAENSDASQAKPDEPVKGRGFNASGAGIYQKIKFGMGQSEIWTKDAKRRMENTTTMFEGADMGPMAGMGNIIMIVRVDKGVQWQLMPNMRIYDEKPIAFAYAPGGTEEANPLKDPEVRDYTMKEDPDACNVTTNKLSETKTFAGYPANGFQSTCGSKSDGDAVMWIAPYTPELRAIQKSMDAFETAHMKAEYANYPPKERDEILKNLSAFGKLLAQGMTGAKLGRGGMGDGIPLAWEIRGGDQPGYFFETVELSRKEPAAALFEIPSGYTQVPDVHKAMSEKMMRDMGVDPGMLQQMQNGGGMPQMPDGMQDSDENSPAGAYYPQPSNPAYQTDEPYQQRPRSPGRVFPNASPVAPIGPGAASSPGQILQSVGQIMDGAQSGGGYAPSLPSTPGGWMQTIGGMLDGAQMDQQDSGESYDESYQDSYQDQEAPQEEQPEEPAEEPSYEEPQE